MAATLRRTQHALAEGNARLGAHRDPLSDRIVANVLSGYAFVGELVASRVDVFAMGNLRNLLELNTIVLCGTDAARREQYARHRQATERRFYEERGGGIQDLVEWYAGHRHEPVWSRAAGVMVRILGRPQLFVEGNHRTGALLMSYLLMAEGEPPFVLSPENAGPYFEPSTVIRSTEKKGPAALFRLPGITRRLAQLLEEHADRRYLLAADSPNPGAARA